MTAPRAPFFPADQSIRATNNPMNVRILGTVDYQQAWEMQVELATSALLTLLAIPF